MNIDELIQEIKSDKISGASELMIKAIKCLTAFSETVDADKAEKYYEGVTGIGRQLIDAQPSMAPLFNAVNTVLLTIGDRLESNCTVEELKKSAKSSSEELLAHSKNALIKIKKQVANLIEGECTILTHSYSSTIIKSLIFAHQEGREIKAIVTESRPLFEGRITARILAENGIKAVLIADMASFHYLNDIDLIMTGSDCICHKGVVNKIGTKGLAIAAFHYNKPFYVLSEKSKFLPSKYMDEPVIEEREPKEILEGVDDVEVKNIYFDITPHRFFRGIITEDGMVGGDEVQAILAQLEVCKELIPK